VAAWCPASLAILLTAIADERLPGTADIAWSMLAGVFGGTAIAALYRGLAVGRMALVAPVTAIIASVIPVVGGFAMQGVPPVAVSLGIGVGLAAVVLVTWEAQDDAGGRAGLWLAVLSGTAFGLFEIAVVQISAEAVLGPLTIIRATQATLIAVVIVVTRPAWRPQRALLPAIAAIGALEVGATATFLVAVQTGALAVASVVSGLYPVVTVLLAAVLLRERVSRLHGVGVSLAMLAVVLIGVGST
jgi:drug/metabolite transporter (DMT)-like permease